jgi:hypothetical protein
LGTRHRCHDPDRQFATAAAPSLTAPTSQRVRRLTQFARHPVRWAMAAFFGHLLFLCSDQRTPLGSRLSNLLEVQCNAKKPGRWSTNTPHSRI